MYYDKKDPDKTATIFAEDKNNKGESMVVYFWDEMGYPENMSAGKFNQLYTNQTDEG